MSNVFVYGYFSNGLIILKNSKHEEKKKIKKGIRSRILRIHETVDENAIVLSLVVTSKVQTFKKASLAMF